MGIFDRSNIVLPKEPTYGGQKMAGYPSAGQEQDSYTFTESQLLEKDKGLDALEQRTDPAGGTGGHPDGMDVLHENVQKMHGDQTGETEQTLAVPKTLSPWDNGFKKGYALQPELSIQSAVSDYQKYAKEKGLPPLDIAEMMEVMGNKDITKSAVDNEKEEKRRVMKERFDRVGNFLSHLGNFVGTLAGAPSQSLESGIELTKRQKALRDMTLAQRTEYNKNFYNYLLKDNDDERKDEAAKLLERKEARLDAESKARIAKNEAYVNYQNASTEKKQVEAAYWKAKYEALERGEPLDTALKEARIAKENAAARLNNVKADKESKGNNGSKNLGLGIGSGSGTKSLGLGIGGK